MYTWLYGFIFCKSTSFIGIFQIFGQKHVGGLPQIEKMPEGQMPEGQVTDTAALESEIPRLVYHLYGLSSVASGNSLHFVGP